MTDGMPHGVFHPPAKAHRLTIVIGESDRWKGAPTHEAIVLRAREAHLAGATVVRGSMGFGAASRIHTAKILRLSEDLPVVITIIDSPAKIAAFLPEVTRMVNGGVVTREEVDVVVYSHESPPA